MFKLSKKNLTSALLGASLMGFVVPLSWGAEPVAVITDLLILRPVGIAATAVGTGAFIATLPITYPSGTASKTSEDLVMKPYRFTFKRPLCGSY